MGGGGVLGQGAERGGAGAAGGGGWMRFLPWSWLEWGVGANGDGVADAWNARDAGYSAARYLAAAGGAARMATQRAWASRSSSGASSTSAACQAGAEIPQPGDGGDRLLTDGGVGAVVGHQQLVAAVGRAVVHDDQLAPAVVPERAAHGVQARLEVPDRVVDGDDD